MSVSAGLLFQPTLDVARGILGKVLVRDTGDCRLAGRIVETEAYNGPQDQASHASRGKTTRNAVMFGVGGYWYVYLIYGMYYCLNVVTEQTDYPAAVLVRAVEPLEGFEFGIRTDGPGKLCRAYGINHTLNGAAAYGDESTLWVEDNGFRPSADDIIAAPRVGVSYAGPYNNTPWRFYIGNNPFVFRR